MVGGVSELSSDGFVVDSTSPIMGEVIHVENRPPLEEASQTFTDSEISVEWSGFLDKESGLKKYHLCVGTQPGECNVMNFTDVGNSTSLHSAGRAAAENRAGLTSDVKSSSGVAVDKTGPINGGQILDGTKEAEDIDIQQSRTRHSSLLECL
ncbi:hypothetical protein OS493_032218 [Desmophyllum pertusum]|uniref:Uncharacterized protein n=1 Tax=Desmophyllum pertusum TaxID=174260 RepID=A0A9W9ZWV6_9CNID|nr:hypothetical protein OS493_032218 [Desmophyllum pertusum]